MQKILCALLVMSSTLVCMEQDTVQLKKIDPAKIPMPKECEDALKGHSRDHDRYAVIEAYAKHGDISYFTDSDRFLSPRRSNKLFKESLTRDLQFHCHNLTSLLLSRSIADEMDSESWGWALKDVLSAGNEELACTMLQKKHDLDFNKDTFSGTLLQIAAFTGSVKFATALLEGGYDVRVDKKSSIESTPLQLAAQWTGSKLDKASWNKPTKKNYSEMLLLLLRHGASSKVTIRLDTEKIFKQDPSKEQPFLEWCVSRGQDECLAELAKRSEVCRVTKIKSEHGDGTVSLLDWGLEKVSVPLVQALIPHESSLHLFGRPKQLDSDCIKKACCAIKKSQELIDFLIAHKHIEKRRSVAQIALRAAVENGWLDTARNIVARYGVSIVTEDDDYYKKMGLLHQASARGDVEMSCQLVEWGCKVYERNDENKTPLSIAIREGQAESVGFLCAQGARIKGTEKRAAYDLLCPSYSSDSQKADVLKQLLEYGLTINGLNQYFCERTNMYALEYILYEQDSEKLELCEILLEAGADPNQFKSRSPLLRAMQSGSVPLVRLLLAHGGSPLGKKLNKPLFTAAVTTKDYAIALLEELYAAGIEPEDSQLLAHVLCRTSSAEIQVVKFLLDHNVSLKEDLSIEKGTKTSPLNFAIYKGGNKELLDLLSMHGAQPDSSDNCSTSLYYAFKGQSEEAISWLAEQGITLATSEGKKALALVLSEISHGYDRKQLMQFIIDVYAERAGGIVSIADAQSHLNRWEVYSHPSAIMAEEWKNTLKWNLFKDLREAAGHTQLPELDELEESISKRAAHLLLEKVKKMLSDGTFEILDELHASGIDLHKVSHYFGRTLLQCAVSSNKKDVVIKLIDMCGFSSELNIEDDFKSSPLSAAKTVDMAQYLLDKGAIVTSHVLSSRVQDNESDEVFSLLLSKRDNTITQKDIQGIYTSAVYGKNADIIRLLIEAGAQPVLEHAVRAARDERDTVVQVLFEHGISPTQVNQQLQREDGVKPLLTYVAINKKNFALLKLVMDTTTDECVTGAARMGWA